MALIKCPKCNNDVEESLTVCSICGYVFEKNADDESPENNNLGQEQNMVGDVAENISARVTEDEESENSLEDTSGHNEALGKNSEKNSTDYLLSGKSLTKEVTGVDLEDINENHSKKLKKRDIKLIIAGGIVVAGIWLLYSMNMNSKYDKSTKELEEKIAQAEQTVLELTSEKETLKNKVSQLESENYELSNGAKKQLSDIKTAYEKGEWQNVIDLTNALHEKYNGSAEDIEAQQLAKTSQENIAQQKAAEEAEKARGYETGITYDQLARTPDAYKNKKVKFSGKVVQVIEGDDSVQIRLAVNNDYDTILLGEYLSSTVSSRVLEDDQITIYGTSVGTISYKSTMGGTITIPGVYIDKIDQ